MSDFLKPGDPALWGVTPKVSDSDLTLSAFKNDVERMVGVAHGNQKDLGQPMMVGLAAPQIGISRRIILVDLAAEGHGSVGDLRVYINPEIVWSSKEESDWYEGCYSTGQVCGVVSRPRQIRIKAWTMRAERVEEEYEGYVARIFQHEIDHLNGLDFVSHINDERNLHWVEDDQYPQYRDQEGWRNWPILCSPKRWASIKGKEA